MARRPPRKARLFAVLDVSEIVGISPTKKLAKQMAGKDKKIIELHWTGGFYSTELNVNLQSVDKIPEMDF